MHSRIFVYSENNSILKSTITTCSFDDHWFTNSIADYVVDSNLHEDIKWLKVIFDCLFIEVDTNNKFLIAHDDFKNRYFYDKYNRFTNLLTQIKDNITLDKFSSIDINLFNDIWQLNNLYNEKYSFYFCNDDMELLTIDEFIRKIKVGCKYYIIKTFYYHS